MNVSIPPEQVGRMSKTHPFQSRSSIVIAAEPMVVFGYVTNPRSWPDWLASSHHIDCEDRPMRMGDTFHEHWSTRTGPTHLDWLVIACDDPWLWIGLTHASFLGPIVVQYDFRDVAAGTEFTRTLRNPARPKPATPEMTALADEDARLALINIKRNVERGCG